MAWRTLCIDPVRNSFYLHAFKNKMFFSVDVTESDLDEPKMLYLRPFFLNFFFKDTIRIQPRRRSWAFAGTSQYSSKGFSFRNNIRDFSQTSQELAVNGAFHPKLQINILSHLKNPL